MTSLACRAARVRTSVTVVVALLAGAAVTGVGGCVTEVVPVENSPTPGRTNSGVPVTPKGTGGGAASSGASGSISSSRVVAAIRPLGTVPYDGLTIPLVTPDGRWLVTQTGSIPPWESVLAEPGATPALGSSIKAYEIVNGALQQVKWAPPGPANSLESPPDETVGMLLGRCSGDGWALVERPNPDGSRWIGKLSLITGKVEWLVQGKMVNAQALLLRNGTLVYTRRAPDQGTAELVIRPAGIIEQLESAETPATSPAAPTPAPLVERVLRRDGWKLCQPLATPDQTMVAVMAIGPQDAQLLALSTTEIDAAGAPTVVAKDLLGPLGAAGAFQAVTSVEACPPEVDSALRSTFLLVNADRRRLAVWDPIKGSMSLLPASVVAGVRVHSAVASGLVMASERGMDFWTGSGVPGRLLAGAYIPRSCGGPAGSRLICLSPQSATSSPAWNVVAVELVAPKP